ncbi:MAG: tetratricopeptide repeat protein [Flavobacteriales bacterium]|nr:tetratricopeptide repeat protein [Flavobacteriales bacterium]
MKKTGLLFAMLIAGTIAFAQPDVTSAYNANKSGDYEAAVGYIEKAIQDPKASVKEKVWRYRGAIYLNVASDPKFAPMYPNAIQLSKESFFKALELDKAGDYKNENMMSLNSLQGIILENASKSYETKDFCSAAQHFKAANEISSKFGIVDSAAIFNSAFCNDKCGKIDEAIEGYKQSAAINYNVPDVYMYISELYTKQGKTEEAKKVITEARAKYPKNVELLRSEVNVLLGEQKYDQALSQLEALTAADPSNETIWFVLGATYEKLGKVADQERAYNKALEINPKYYDALFNLAATHYNKGVEQMKECDKIPMRETAKFDACKAEAGKHFQTSIGFFERAYDQKPEEQEIITALAEAYLRVENQAGYDKLKAKMKK